MKPPVPATAERRHHSYSPSTLQMREACCLWAPTGESNEKAERGTKQHTFTEDRKDDGSLTDEEYLAAVDCLEYSGKIKARFINANRRMGAVGTCSEVTEITEKYLPLDERKWTVSVFDPEKMETKLVTEDCTTGGYVDRMLLVPFFSHIEMFDWKFGRWPVTDAHENLQGIAYVLAAFRLYPWAETIRLHFKQPQIDSVTKHVFRRTEIPSLLLKVMTVVERAAAAAKIENYSQANMTVPGCLFCGRRGKCHKLHELILTVGNKFYPAKMPKNMDPIALDDPQNAAEGLRVAQIVEAWASGYRRQKTLQILAGKAPVPEGFRIMKFEKREIKSEFRFFRVLRQYLSAKEIRRIISRPSITALEKAISDKFPRGSKSAQLEVIGQRLMEVGAVQMTQPTPYVGAVPKKKDKQPTD